MGRPLKGDGSSPQARGTRQAAHAGGTPFRFIPAGAGNTWRFQQQRAHTTVHPRRRGEHLRRLLKIIRKSGSSPQARGTRSRRFCACCCRRFIPAGAGNTRFARSVQSRMPVHPRRRGEHTISRTLEAGSTGSSPQARGTHRKPCAAGRRCRFIPAGAGNTSETMCRRPSLSVHPRRRGEHPISAAMCWPSGGSSPQARGTHPDAGAQRCQRRFIPAGAGNTSSGYSPGSSRTVHPRRRGEHAVGDDTPVSTNGSSPQARGTLELGALMTEVARFIPAGAGNTVWHATRALPWAVHPRRRGEHLNNSALALAFFGSSPQARGTHLAFALRALFRQFIPAGAGNTAGEALLMRPLTVHPRRRGEHLLARRTPTSAPGSSPQARGTPCMAMDRPASFRFIPAGAGNTGTCRSAKPARPVHPRRRGEHG